MSGSDTPVSRTAKNPEHPLVPLLPMEGNAPDPVALATWHLALSSTTAVEVPHDLFALWLFPMTGGAVLLGPEALAQDNVVVPIPSPCLLQDQLFGLEEVLRKAHYESAMAVPIRDGVRDAGVMLLGSFAKGAYGPKQALALRRLAEALTDTLSRLGQVLTAPITEPVTDEPISLETLPLHVAHAAAEAANGPDLARWLSTVLYPILPHDRLELLASGAAEHSFVPLSGNAPKRRWTASGGVVEPFTAIVSRFGSSSTLLVDDLIELDGEGSWAIGSGGAEALPARAILGARMAVSGETVGYLLLGSVASEAYRPDDEDVLATVALLVAPRVAGFRLAAEAAGLRTDATASETPVLPLTRVAEALASTGHLGEALRRFSAGLKEVLPHQRISLHLRWGEDDVIEINPDAPRPFADLPAVPLDSYAGGPVIRGIMEWLVLNVGDDEEVLVALTVAGRPVGTLGVRAPSFPSTGQAAAIAQQFANILAPHLELLRRSASSGVGPAARMPRAPAAIDR